MATIQRAGLQRGDIALWDGSTRTASRVDATGGTVTGLTVGDSVDVVQVYGSGTDRTNITIANATAKIGSSNVTLLFATGTWEISSNLTIPSNFSCFIPAGCVFSVSSGVTLTFSGTVFTENASWYSGSGTVVASSVLGPNKTAAEISAGVTPVNYQYPELTVDRYGTNSTPGTTDMTTAVQAACDVAAAKGGGQVRLLPHVYLCTDNIDINVGDGETVDIIGTGWANGGILFSGSGVTTGLTYTGSGLDYGGTIQHLRVRCQSSAARCITFLDVNHPRVVRCRLAGASGAAVMFDSTLMGLLSHTLITGSGSATEGSVEVQNTSGDSTTFRWEHSRISGGDDTVGGLIIDKTAVVNIDGGAIESCGAPIKIGTRSDSSGSIYRQFHIHNIDLENPGNNPYIDLGSGLSGGTLLQNIEINSVDASPSGTTTVPHFLRADNFSGLSVNSNHFTLGSAPTSCFEIGSTASGVNIYPHRNLTALGVAWVRVNETQVKAAGPRTTWNSEECGRGLVQRTSLPNLTGTTPSVLVSSTMGGYYGRFGVTNGSATTITSLSDGELGMEIEISATNGNTTLTHGTGSGEFFCVGASNLTLTANLVYRFRHNGTYWAQVTG